MGCPVPSSLPSHASIRAPQVSPVNQLRASKALERLQPFEPQQRWKKGRGLARAVWTPKSYPELIGFSKALLQSVLQTFGNFNVQPFAINIRPETLPRTSKERARGPAKCLQVKDWSIFRAFVLLRVCSCDAEFRELQRNGANHTPFSLSVKVPQNTHDAVYAVPKQDQATKATETANHRISRPQGTKELTFWKQEFERL